MGADALEILDELVECEVAILQPHIKTVVGFCLEVSLLLTVLYAGFPRLLESPGFFFLENSMTWKVLENHFGPGKSWKLKLKVLESPGKISLKVMHFSTITACI